MAGDDDSTTSQTLSSSSEFIQDLTDNDGVTLQRLVYWMRQAPHPALTDFAKAQYDNYDQYAAVLEQLGPADRDWIGSMKNAALDLLLTFGDIEDDLNDDSQSSYFSRALGAISAQEGKLYEVEVEGDDDDMEEDESGEKETLEVQLPPKKRKKRSNRSGTKTNIHHRKQAAARINKVPRKVPHPSDPLPGYTAERPPEYEEAPEYHENVEEE